MKLFPFFYDLCAHLAAIGLLPKIIMEAIRKKKYRKSFLFRLGLRFPKIKKDDRRLVWVHAVSMGETKAAALLIKRLKSLPRAPLILLSTVTETGHAEGKKSAPEADWHVYLPIDISYIIRPIVKKVRPDLLILTETDFWFHLQDATKKAGGSIALINGKLSDRSFKRFLKFPFFTNKLMQPIDSLCLQGDQYKKRFEKLGVQPSRITVTGNLKLDGIANELPPDEVERAKLKFGLSGKHVLTLGSTHDPEEKLWMHALESIWEKHPHLNVFLVPRHPERFSIVAELLESKNIGFSLWSKNQGFQNKRVMLVDAMGVLSYCYQLSDVTFVGGSLTPKVGGHNIIEPCFFGKPVLFGPWMQGQPDLLDIMNTYRGGVQIEPEEIAPALEQILADSDLREALGKNGRQLDSSSRGALDSTFEVVLRLLEKSTS